MEEQVGRDNPGGQPETDQDAVDFDDRVLLSGSSSNNVDDDEDEDDGEAAVLDTEARGTATGVPTTQERDGGGAPPGSAVAPGAKAVADKDGTQKKNNDGGGGDDDDDDRDRIRTVGEDLSLLREKLAEADRKNLDLSAKLEEMANKNRALETDKAGLEDEKRKLEEELEDTKKTLKANKKILKATKKTLEDTKKTLKATKKTLQKTKKTLEKTKLTLEKAMDSMATEMVLALVQGLTGWAPFLPFSWIGENWVEAGDPPPTNANGGRQPRNGGRRSGITINALFFCEWIWARIRKPYFVFVSLVDLADFCLDIALAVSVIYDEDSCEESLKGWAALVLVMSILARVMSGIYGVVYKFIDESDRELTYFLVELTIVMMEDMASISYVWLKFRNTGEMNGLDLANINVTIVCIFFFLVPTFWRYKRITQQLSRFASRVLLLFYGAVIIFTVVVIVIEDFLLTNQTIVENMELIFQITYSGVLAIQLFILYDWSRQLYRKRTNRRRDPRY